MCGRIVYVWDPVTKALVQKLVDDADLDDATRHVLHKERYNVPPASHLPVIRRHDGANSVAVARWGFPIPQRPNGVFNTRIETAFESPMWRGLMGHHHCLFPVKGFYEWTRDGKRKTPHYVHRADGDVMLLGGLIGQRQVDGITATCASVVTCVPNAAMESIHDRMPVIIETKQAQNWLDADADTALKLAVPAGDVLAIHEVGAAVGNTANDGPELMAPVGQRGLGSFD